MTTQNKHMAFTIERLPHVEHHGDWHDKPTKWIAKASDAAFTQKFSTRKDAELWRRCVRRTNTFNEACHLYQNS